MQHRTLRHVRRTLAVALGLSALACDQSPAVDPPDADVPDAAVGACLDEQPLLGPEGEPTGYVRCADDGIDRVGPAACPAVARWPACSEAAASRGGATCAADSDCTDGPGGVCGLLDPVFGDCTCIYPCQSDADCPADQACVCETSHGARCAPANCRGPDDCGGGRCGVADYLDGSGCNRSAALACREAADACASNVACDDGADCFPAGVVGADAPWQCSGPLFACGRPLRAGAAARLAPGARRGDWRGGAAPAVCADRPVLAAHWAAIAALEHASVASFARFSLQLLALGAPADLLADCQQAAADEVEHARMAYAIASVFAGEAVGPGPLSLDGITLDVDPASVLREVIIEGCIGETLGAVEAAEAARTVEDPAIAAACARIAEDELRHAALGWRTARWLLGCHPGLAEMASTAFLDGMWQHGEGITPSADPITTHGIAARPALRRATWHAVIAPLAERLVRLG